MPNYRIKIVETKNHTYYYPQWRWLFFWTTYTKQANEYRVTARCHSMEEAQKYIDKDISHEDEFKTKVTFYSSKEWH